MWGLGRLLRTGKAQGKAQGVPGSEPWELPGEVSGDELEGRDVGVFYTGIQSRGRRPWQRSGSVPAQQDVSGTGGWRTPGMG